MLFRRKTTAPATGPSGPVRFGLGALLSTEGSVGASVAVQTSALGGLDRLARDDVHRFSDGLSAAGYALGRAATGHRATAVLDADGLRSAQGTVADAVRSRIPFVLHVVCRDDWSAALTAGAAGAIVLVTPDVRDIGVLTVAAHRVSEEVLLPVVCVHDGMHVAYASADVPAFDADRLTTLLPHRLTGTPGERLLFDDERPAVPSWLAPDRPAGVGARMDGIDEAASDAGRGLFLDRELAERVDRALAVVADALGRPVAGTRMEGTDRKTPVIAAAGPLAILAARVASDRNAAFRALACTRLVPFPADALPGDDAPVAVLVAAADGPLVRGLVADRAHRNDRAVSLACHAGGGGLPTTKDLEALAHGLKNGTVDVERSLFVGAWRPADRPGIPEAERAMQRLRSAAPDADRRLVHSSMPDAGVAQAVFVGPVVADVSADELPQAISGEAKRAVRTTRMRSTADAPTTGVVWGAPAASPVPARTRLLAAESAALLDRAGLDHVLAKGGVVLVPDPERISPEAAGRIRAASAELYGLDIAEEEPLDVPFRLLRAALVLAGMDPDPETVFRNVVGRLHEAGALTDAHADRLLSAGTSSTPRGPVEVLAERSDPSPPSTLIVDATRSERYDDPGHFWRTVGYAAAAGRAAELMPDPHRAIGVMPARAGWAPSGSGHPTALPALVPERCTGCGACWTVCPESAIQPAAPSFQALFDAAIDALGRSGGEAFQLGRLSKAVVQEAYKVFRDDALHQFPSVRSLMGEAVVRVMDRAKLEGEKRSAVESELETLAPHWPAIDAVRTEPWFDAQEDQAKGSGRPLLVTTDPDRCTACGACIAACGEAALEPTAATADRMENERLGAAFSAALPPLPAEAVDVAAAVEPASLLLERRAAHAAAGGDAAPLRRASIRAMAVAAEALRSPAFDRFAGRVREAREAVEAAMQQTVSGTLGINDFEAFARRLGRLGDDITPERLAEATGAGSAVDGRRLERLADVRSRLASLESRLSTGEGRARLVAVFDGQDRPTWPINPYAFPWIRVAPGTGASVLSAVADDLVERHLHDVSLVRHAEQLARDTTEAVTVPVVDRASLTDDEVDASPIPLLVTDRLSEGVVSLLDGDRTVRVLLLRSDPTAPDAGDPGIAAVALGNACVVQSSLAAPRHLVRGLETAFTTGAPSLVCLHAPDGLAPLALDRARRAIASRVLPVFVYVPDVGSSALDLDGNPDPSADFTTEAGARVTPVNWLALEPAHRSSFRFVPRGEAPPDAVDAADLLAGGAGSGTPIVAGPRGTAAVVPARAMLAASRRVRAWRRLRMLASRAAARPAETPSAPSPVPTPPAEIRTLVPDEVHARLTARLLALSGFGPGSQGSDRPLRELVADPEAEGS